MVKRSDENETDRNERAERGDNRTSSFLDSLEKEESKLELVEFLWNVCVAKQNFNFISILESRGKV